jgi:hypothetical protein
MANGFDAAGAAFIALPLLVAAATVAGTWVAYRRAGASGGHAARVTTVIMIGIATWMAATWVLAARGTLAHWETIPSPFMVLALVMASLAMALVVSPVGRHLATLPLWALVGLQGFRLPLELAMHTMAERGVMPPQMTYTGANFDIVTGASAFVVAGLLLTGVGGHRLVAGWNALGLILLANIVGIAIVSTPTFGWYGPDRLNTWVTGVPFVWLPAVLVQAALAGHLVIWRALGTKTARNVAM